MRFEFELYPAVGESSTDVSYFVVQAASFASDNLAVHDLRPLDLEIC